MVAGYSNEGNTLSPEPGHASLEYAIRLKEDVLPVCHVAGEKDGIDLFIDRRRDQFVEGHPWRVSFGPVGRHASRRAPEVNISCSEEFHPSRVPSVSKSEGKKFWSHQNRFLMRFIPQVITLALERHAAIPLSSTTECYPR